MISKMLFSSLRLDEFLSYCGEINSYLKSFDKKDIQIRPAIDKFDLNYNEAIETAHRERTNKFTDLLLKRDHRRDESFIAFRDLMNANTHREEERIADAAIQICRIIRSHGWSLQKDSRAVQSAKMASLSMELSKPENKILIATLNATEWYREMVENNKVFNQTVHKKAEANANEKEYDTIIIYKELRNSCEELFESIEVLHRMFPNEKYVQMAEFINSCSEQHLIFASTRKTKNAKIEQKA